MGTNEEQVASISSVTMDTVKKYLFVVKMFYKC